MMDELLAGEGIPDRITEMLRPSNPLLNIGQAAAASIGGGNFGANLSRLQAGDTNKAMALMQLMRGIRQDRNAERSADIQERRLGFEERRVGLSELVAQQRHDQTMRRLGAMGGGGSGGGGDGGSSGRTQGERELNDYLSLKAKRDSGAPLSPLDSTRLEILEQRVRKPAGGAGLSITTAGGDVITLGGAAAGKEMLARDDEQSAALSMLASSGNVRNLLKADPVLGMGGGAIRALEGVAQQARTLGTKFMSPEQTTRILDPSQYSFGKLTMEASRSAAAQSAITAIAFNVALSRNGGRGPITDRDVQRALNEIGAESGSIPQIIAGLDQVVKGTIRDYRMRTAPQDFDKFIQRAKGEGLQLPGEEAAPAQTAPAGDPKKAALLEEARKAIREGAPRDAVKKRLRELEIEPPEDL